MPALGMAQETGKLLRWLKGEGEPVVKGEPLMEIETDKAAVEVEAPASGTLAGIRASEGEDIAVGQGIAMILAAGESLADAELSIKRAVATKAAPSEAPAQPTTFEAGPAPTAGRPKASPKARRLAAERGVDISRLAGSGPGGAVLEEDILQSGAGAAVGKSETESPLWRAMAANVSKSWQSAPHFFVIREVDATWLGEERSRQPAGVTYTDLLVKAVASSLRRHPRMNVARDEVNVGLAVALPDGLIVPVIHQADRMTVDEIANRRRELIDRVKAGRVRAQDVSGGTFTLSNLGMYGVDLFTAILAEGQAGILAIGRIADRVVARAGVPQVRPTMLLSLSCDHRLVDGARAAEFVQTLTELLEGTAPA